MQNPINIYYNYNNVFKDFYNYFDKKNPFYKKLNKIEMDIFRNGELIGYNYYFFTRKGDQTIITNQIKFSVKLIRKWKTVT